MIQGIAEKLYDALTMFWQALDERERIMLAYLVTVLVLGYVERRIKQRREQEQSDLAERIAERLERGAAA